MSDPATLVDLAGINITAGSLGIMATGIVGAISLWFKLRAEGRETRKEHAVAKAEAATALDDRLRPIETAIGTFKSKEALAEDKAALMREVDDLRHDLKGGLQQIVALDHKRQETDRWAAKVDLTIANIEKGQDRIERDMKEGFGRLEKLLTGRGKHTDD